MERASAQRAKLGPDFILLSGEDVTALGFNAHGGHGCISVTSNVAPRLCAEFQAATLANDKQKALELQDRLMPLHKTIFLEAGVTGSKYALSRLGRVGNTVRSPLVTVEPATAEKIDAAMRSVGLLK
jgi:4-hydroxy-tetrahydrodipicolinate synthase